MGETYSFSGEHYTLLDSPALPKPAQQPVPVIVGGKGQRRTPALAARFATEFTVPFAPLAESVAQYERVAQACVDAGRDPARLVRSCAHTLVVGATGAEIARRGEAAGLTAEELDGNPLAGTPARIVDQLGRWRSGPASPGCTSSCRTSPTWTRWRSSPRRCCRSSTGARWPGARW